MPPLRAAPADLMASVVRPSSIFPGEGFISKPECTARARAFAALGMALCNQGSYEAAIPPLTKSLQLDPSNTWEAQWALAKTDYHLKRYDDALKLSEESLQKSNGKAPEIALLVAQSLTAVGRYEEAARLLRQFLTDHADRPEVTLARRWLDQLTASGKIRSN